MSWIENEKTGYQQILDTIFKSLGNAYRIGITGPPGAGKSTLTNQLTKIFRDENLKTGIVAVDPTSPFTGGAILGDRIRMNDLTMDRGVFIRSMATRGSSGGLARQATEVADVLDAAGYDIIIYETVGVGQVELDIAQAADTTVVIVVPESGDIIQSLKSGLMEIADIFILNKSDRPGAERMQKDIEYVLHLRDPKIAWYPEVIQTVAHKGEGVNRLRQQIAKHQDFQNTDGHLQAKRDARLKGHIERIIRHGLEYNFWNEDRRRAIRAYLDEDKKDLSPYVLADKMMGKISGLK
ncbi:MAG: methylmalonyl Co-A mutase-associated GTPase MeaB [Calditrichales bacterium]|nr:MAG: methylmalonyl Co-A mutase-associated GTPase MeaB [Calditrichales bacterium]